MEQFDKVYREINGYTLLMSKLGIGIMLFLAGMLTMIPYQMEEGEAIIPLYVFGFLNMELGIYMNCYTSVPEGKKKFTIFQKLKYIPIDPHSIRKSRRELLFRFLGKVTLLMQLLQLASALVFCREIKVWNFYPLLVGVIIGALWLLYLHWCGRTGK